jgi:hypothetical protein
MNKNILALILLSVLSFNSSARFDRQIVGSIDLYSGMWSPNCADNKFYALVTTPQENIVFVIDAYLDQKIYSTMRVTSLKKIQSVNDTYFILRTGKIVYHQNPDREFDLQDFIKYEVSKKQYQIIERIELNTGGLTVFDAKIIGNPNAGAPTPIFKRCS